MQDDIVILTGSGISAESGIKTFRDSNGLWENHKVEDVATPQGFARNPALVQRFYNQRRAQLAEVAPNAAHLALAQLAAKWPGNVTIVTQNVDDLHERAAQALEMPETYRLLHMHGELKKVHCEECRAVVAWEDELPVNTYCKACLRGTYRPDIVWFGEMPYHMEAIARALHRCSLFVSIGTSGNVYPAAGFVQDVRNIDRAHTIELNMEPSMGYSLFHEKKYGPASEIVPAFVEQLLGFEGR